MQRGAIKEFFKKYYRNNANSIEEPTRIEAREFGFMLFDKNVMVRHLSFKNGSKLRDYVKETTPAHAYYSSAYYANPSAPTMDEKGWLGADLVFDIDVDHIETPCKKDHDKWRCLNCGFSGVGMSPSKCPHCGSEKIERKMWICDLCIEAAKDEALKVCDILLDELGFSSKDLYLVFSGHRGFHIHVEEEKVIKMDQDARREIVDYLLGIGLDLNTLGYFRRKVILDIDLREHGWRGRVARGLYDVLLNCSEELLKRIGLRSREVKYILDNKDKILSDIERIPSNWLTLSKISAKSLKRLIDYAVKLVACKVDERVTIDVKRLIRLPGTLHGKTGFKVLRLSYSELDSFNISDAFVFDTGIHVIVKSQDFPKKVANYMFSKRKGLEKVPLPIGIYLIGNSKDIEVIKIE